MSVTARAGDNVALLFTFPGGDITSAQITIDLDGSPIVGPTAAGIGAVGSGVYSYVWQTSTALAAGTYAATLEGVDGGPVEQTETIHLTTNLVYASLDKCKNYLRIAGVDEQDDEELLDALTDVSDGISTVCERTFGKETVASTRTFPGGSPNILLADDFWTTDDLVINGEPWPVSGVTLLPRNGYVNGLTGWPYNRLRSSSAWGCEDVDIAAKWGWALVPNPVRQSTLILTAETFKLKDAPWGVAGWGSDFAVRIRNNPIVAEKLRPFLLNPAVGI